MPCPSANYWRRRPSPLAAPSPRDKLVTRQLNCKLLCPGPAPRMSRDPAAGNPQPNDRSRTPACARTSLRSPCRTPRTAAPFIIIDIPFPRQAYFELASTHCILLTAAARFRPSAGQFITKKGAHPPRTTVAGRAILGARSAPLPLPSFIRAREKR